MTTNAILSQFDDLAVWKQGDQRAPHKPLLILYALGRWQRGLTEVSFREAEPELTGLLREFGPLRKSDRPEQPFWRLQRDGVWSVTAVRCKKSSHWFLATRIRGCIDFYRCVPG
jgi:putative restriction endonuclease